MRPASACPEKRKLVDFWVHRARLGSGHGKHMISDRIVLKCPPDIAL